MLDKKHSSWRGAIIASTFSVLIVVAIVWGMFNRQFVVDQINFITYKPDPGISTISDMTSFNEKGQFYFYSSKPALNEAEDFNKNCPRQEVGSPIVGCYHRGQIFIYDIDNPDLSGIKEVTAAHEMLHAAWDRLSSSDKKRLSVLLQDEYKRVNNADLRKRMDYYARVEPDQMDNELHSIVATEVRSISIELEDYYSQYFKDRKKILDLYDGYYSSFSALYKQSDKLYKELIDLGNDIDTRSNQYKQDVSQLEADIDSFNARAASGGFQSMDQFYAERWRLITRSESLAADRTAINKDIQAYDAKYVEYKEVGAQIEALNKSLDSYSKLDPAPTVN